MHRARPSKSGTRVGRIRALTSFSAFIQTHLKRVGGGASENADPDVFGMSAALSIQVANMLKCLGISLSYWIA